MRDWDEADGGATERVGGGPEAEAGRPSEPGTAAPRAPGWEPVRLLGAGAQAEVWLVEDGRGVRSALKVPRAGAAPDALAAEAQAGRVAHPHLLRVLGAVETDRGLGVLTEHRAAGTLQDMVQRVGPLSPGQAVTVLVPIAQALACLHREGVVHGDVSPANVLFGVDGSPALADLGVARVVGGASGAGATPGFAAPEALAAVQGAGAEPGASPAVGAPSDVHAWAALGWYALTGRAPGAAGHRAPLPVLVPEASPELALLLDAALSPDPVARPSAEEAAAAVYATARPEPVPLGEAAPAEVAHLLPTVLPGTGPTRRRRGRRGRRAAPG
ncbi:protein kinase, partial [Micrococcus luteus]|uniref:protein kinase domain-containing protein n=2 Tax=Micrococcus luteus TaxID=1270 RepID=UPI0019D0BA73